MATRDDIAHGALEAAGGDDTGLFIVCAVLDPSAR
jgi:hypothetical protein